MKNIAIIQARMGSTRLPGKVLMPLGETNVLGFLIKRLKTSKSVEQIVVATSVNAENNQIINFCNKENIEVFKGDEDDVLERFYQCAQKYSADLIVRITADSPFIDIHFLDTMIEFFKERSLNFLGVDPNEVPRGIVGELFSFEELERTYLEANDKEYREHVTLYMYEKPKNKDKVVRVLPEEFVRQRKHYRLTLDTEEDYKVLSNLALKLNSVNASIQEILTVLDNNPELSYYNAHVNQKKVR